jgi:flagellar motor protein MotB
MKKQAPVEEKGETAPLWIISFADMISLLMAFFVMLLTMATAKSGTLCNEGLGVFEHSVGSFRKAVAGFGMPELFGSGSESLEFESDRAHFGLSTTDEQLPAQRTTDGAEEKTRRLFQVLDRQSHTFKAQIRGRNPEFTAIPIHFSEKRTTLSKEGADYLSQLAVTLQEVKNPEKVMIYIVGVASKETTIRDQWILSAKRAQTTAQFLKSKLPANTKIRIFCWGAGTGGEWTASGTPPSKEVDILMAILNNDGT